MKKTLKILVVVCSMLLLAGAFSSCAKKIPTDSAYSKLRDALESSLQYKTYYIQEMITHDKLLDKTTVNLRCKLDKNYQPILKNGRLKRPVPLIPYIAVAMLLYGFSNKI